MGSRAKSQEVIGENYFNLRIIGHKNDKKTSTHAEMCAMRQLLNTLRNIKKHKKIQRNLLVIRETRSGKLASSRPCFNCLDSMEKICDMHNIYIRWIYYSTQDGTIVRERFKDMKSSDLTYVSSGNRNKN